MGATGIARVMAQLVTHLAMKHDVTLMTWETPGTPSCYRLPSGIRLVQADRLGGRGMHKIRNLLSRPAAIRREVTRTRPDVIISFVDMMNVIAVAGTARLGIPRVVSERTDPAMSVGWMKARLRDAAYGFAEVLVCQTKTAADRFPAPLQRRIRIIPNPVPASAARATPDRPDASGRFRMIGVGRLAPQKGFDRLIDAFALIAQRHPEWDLTVFGEGELRAALTGQARRLGIESRVQFPGETPAISDELAKSHVMAFPSLYEGFPNALAEGLAAGLPGVAFVGVAGVDELVVDGETGFIVDGAGGAEALGASLSALMAEPLLRARMGEAARRHVATWEPAGVFARWDSLLDDVSAGRIARGTR